MADKYYCPQCLNYGEPGAEFCVSCGAKLVPPMRIVIMPFVESGQEPKDLGEYRGLVERDGVLSPTMAIGCQLYMQSDLERSRLMASQKEVYFQEAERILPRMVKDYLEPMVFYDIPDPDEVERITREAADMPTELFVIIQNRYDPEYLFLPEIDHFFFRYPRLHTSGTGPDAGFGFVRLSAFLLDNRENRIVSRGSGSGLELYRAPEIIVDENFTVPLEEQLEVMQGAASRAVESLLRNMKMIK